MKALRHLGSCPAPVATLPPQASFPTPTLSAAVDSRGSQWSLWIGHLWLSGETWVVQYGGVGGGGAAWSLGLSIGMRVPAWGAGITQVGFGKLVRST